MSQMQENVIENNLLVNQHVNGGKSVLNYYKNLKLQSLQGVNLHLYYRMISFSRTRNKYDNTLH